MRRLMAIISVSLCEICCTYAEPETLSWNGRTAFATNATISELNALANGGATNETEKSKAVFALFANYVRPGQTAAQVHRVLADTHWLEHAYLYGVYELAGQIPVEMTFEDTVFCLGLFPHSKKWTDWPSASAAPHGVLANTEPQTDWVIYFRLSGSPHWSKVDALAFFRGEPVTGNPKIVEFALCFPHPTSPGHIVDRIERFTQRGTQVYERERVGSELSTRTNSVSHPRH